MAHLPEIPASAYTPEMDILGVIPDIPVFEGDRVPVSRNALTPGTRPLQLLPASGSDFPIRQNTDAMRGFQSEMRHAAVLWKNSSVTQLSIWARPELADLTLLPPPFGIYWTPLMRSRVIATGFGDYAAGLRRTQPRFPPAMRYALMERWNDCTHSFIFGFGEMTLTPADFTAITGLGFDGDAVLLDSRYKQLHWELSLLDLSFIGTYDWASLALAHLYHGLDVWTKGSGESNWQFLPPLEVWAYEYRIYPGGPDSDTSTEARRFLDTWHIAIILFLLLLTPWEGDAWAAYPPRALAEALARSRVLLHGYWVDRYYLGERVLEIRTATAQRRVPIAPPRHMCILEGITPEDRLLEYDGFPVDDYLIPGDYASYLSTRLRTRLPDAEVDAPAESTGAMLGDVPFPLGMEVTLDPSLGLRRTIAIPADLRQAPPYLQLDPEHATHVPAQRYQELYKRFCFARTYITSLYPELHERELEIGRLRRHQSRQAAAVSRLQMEVDRLRTRLEVEGIPLDLSDEEEEDDDDSSSEDAPPPPPSSVRQAAAGPSR
ncbi:hypothetical protein JCGZ_03769 [Jatropha curcas]|uniref:Aminotransferase-like plant mobile domain-containing protein n=1 Tax=Jatropha curcas TaxID=180498 RepID=A0A067L8H4_JATCU|nr:hypothetical protein JCGZ_03769 [Jatropha curcas]